MEFNQLVELNRRSQRSVPYKIQRGDSLTTIARNNNTSIQELLALNPEIKNPNLIYSGRSIRIPNEEYDPKAKAVLNTLQSSQRLQNMERGPQPPTMGGGFDPHQDAIESVAPEMNLMGAGAMPKAMLGAMGGLAALMPKTALVPQMAGRVAAGRLGSNVAMPWQPQISRGMAGALTNSAAHRAALANTPQEASLVNMLTGGAGRATPDSQLLRLLNHSAGPGRKTADSRLIDMMNRGRSSQGAPDEDLLSILNGFM
jgi:LysM repeat protein